MIIRTAYIYPFPPPPHLSLCAESDDELRLAPLQSETLVGGAPSGTSGTPAGGGLSQGIELQQVKLPAAAAAAAAVGKALGQGRSEASASAASKVLSVGKARGAAPPGRRGPPKWLRSIGACWGGNDAGCDAQRNPPLQSAPAAEKARSPQGECSSALMEELLGTTTHVIHCAAR